MHKSRAFTITVTVSYVHLCPVCMWRVSSSLIKFCVHHSSSLSVSLPSLLEAQEGLRWHWRRSKGQAGVTHGGSI